MCGSGVPSVYVGVFSLTKTNPFDSIHCHSSKVKSSRIKYFSFFTNIIQGTVAYKAYSLGELECVPLKVSSDQQNFSEIQLGSLFMDIILFNIWIHTHLCIHYVLWIIYVYEYIYIYVCTYKRMNAEKQRWGLYCICPGFIMPWSSFLSEPQEYPVTFWLPTAWRKQKWMKWLGTCSLVSGRAWWFCLEIGLSYLKWTEMPLKLEMYTGHKISVYTCNDSTSSKWPLSPGSPDHKGVVSASAPLLFEQLLILPWPSG